MARLLLALVASVAVLTGCGDGYDETAHRAEVERAIGAEMADWPRYLEAARGACDLDEDAFAFYVAAGRDEGTENAAATQASVRHLCPERMSEIAEKDRELADQRARCANPVTEDDMLIREAYDEMGIAC